MDANVVTPTGRRGDRSPGRCGECDTDGASTEAPASVASDSSITMMDDAAGTAAITPTVYTGRFEQRTSPHRSTQNRARPHSTPMRLKHGTTYDFNARSNFFSFPSKSDASGRNLNGSGIERSPEITMDYNAWLDTGRGVRSADPTDTSPIFSSQLSLPKFSHGQKQVENSNPPFLEPLDIGTSAQQAAAQWNKSVGSPTLAVPSISPNSIAQSPMSSTGRTFMMPPGAGVPCSLPPPSPSSSQRHFRESPNSGSSPYRGQSPKRSSLSSASPSFSGSRKRSSGFSLLGSPKYCSNRSSEDAPQLQYPDAAMEAAMRDMHHAANSTTHLFDPFLNGDTERAPPSVSTLSSTSCDASSQTYAADFPIPPQECDTMSELACPQSEPMGRETEEAEHIVKEPKNTVNMEDADIFGASCALM